MLGKFTTAGPKSDELRRKSALEAIKFLYMTCDSMMSEDGDLRCHEKGIVDMGSLCRIVRMRLAGLLDLGHNILVFRLRSIGVGVDREPRSRSTP